MSNKHVNEARTRRRTDVAYGLVALASLVLVTCLALWIQNLSQDLRVSNEARDALARQVQTLGEKPVAGPPGSRGEPGKSVTGPKGDTGPTGPPGPTGERGPKGDKGDTGSHGTDATGSPGSDGVNGADGTNGADGAQGPPGPAGPQGEPGPAGADGKDGSDGRDGQTCPDGYSLQAPSYDPDALVCRRNDAPDPEPAPKQGLFAAGLDPNRRMYA